MENFVIITDSCSELSGELRQKYGVEYVPMHFTYEGKEYIADHDWKELSAHEFYELMRGGVRITTSQVNVEEYKTAFRKYLDEGKDILSISCSAPLSSSVKASFVARDQLLKEYPDRKIICIDSTNSCIGLGIICLSASEKRSEGMTIEEVASWVEENKKFVHMEATVEKLTYLKQAGRVSATSAFFGGILSVKPIIISDKTGANVSVEKVKGRKASFTRIAERIKERIVDCPHQKVFVAHGDCEEDANTLIEEIRKVLPENYNNLAIEKCFVGPIVGASCGPGVIGAFFYGIEV